MNLGKSGLLFAIAASLLVAGGCNPAQDQEPTTGPVAATVNGKAISQRTVDMIAEQGASSGRPDTAESRRAIIDQLALQMLIADEAIKLGLDKTPDVAEQLGVAKQSILANAYVEDFINNNPVSDEMLAAEYERIKETISGNEYHARHILVETESEASDIIALLDEDPDEFANVAMERSLDTGSGANGGDLGWFDLDRMVPEFSAAVSALEVGQYTEAPVRTDFGYHVILVEGVQPIEAPPLEEVATELTQQLQQQTWDEQLDALKASATIEVVE